MSAFLDLLAQRVVVYDGATGTYLQQCGLTADDFGGRTLEGCIAALVRVFLREKLRYSGLSLRLRRKVSAMQHQTSVGLVNSSKS